MGRWDAAEYGAEAAPLLPKAADGDPQAERSSCFDALGPIASGVLCLPVLFAH